MIVKRHGNWKQIKDDRKRARTQDFVLWLFLLLKRNKVSFTVYLHS